MRRKMFFFKRKFIIITCLVVAIFFVPAPQRSHAFRFVDIDGRSDLSSHYVVTLFYHDTLVSHALAKLTGTFNLTPFARNSAGGVVESHPPHDRKTAPWLAAARAVDTYTNLDVPLWRGISLESLQSTSPLALAGLRSGDVLTYVGTKEISFMAIREWDMSLSGETLLTFFRDDVKHQSTIDLTRHADPWVGVTFAPYRSHVTEIPATREPVVEFGNSVQLSYALAFADFLTPGSLHGGRIIAASGVVSSSGQVGKIIGFNEKVRAAGDAGATVFFIPSANKEEAEGRTFTNTHGEPLEVVPVSTVTDALRHLCVTSENSASELCIRLSTTMPHLEHTGKSPSPWWLPACLVRGSKTPGECSN